MRTAWQHAARPRFSRGRLLRNRTVRPARHDFTSSGPAGAARAQFASCLRFVCRRSVRRQGRSSHAQGLDARHWSAAAVPGRASGRHQRSATARDGACRISTRRDEEGPEATPSTQSCDSKSPGKPVRCPLVGYGMNELSQLEILEPEPPPSPPVLFGTVPSRLVLVSVLARHPPCRLVPNRRTGRWGWRLETDYISDHADRAADDPWPLHVRYVQRRDPATLRPGRGSRQDQDTG